MPCKNGATLRKLAVVLGLLFFFTACEYPTQSEEQENYDLFHELNVVEGAEKANVTIHQGPAVGRDAYFEFKVENINSSFIAPGVYDGWCIEWTKPIA